MVEQTMSTDVQVPALGESITEATLGQWLKQPGEAVQADEPIASLETDKVAVDVPSPITGVLSEQLVGEGDTVAVGALIARIDAAGAAVERTTPTSQQTVAADDRTKVAEIEAAASAPATAAPSGGEGTPALTLSPAVRRLVLEHGLDSSYTIGRAHV